MKHILCSITAAAAAGLLLTALPASADEQAMTFRLDASRSYVFAHELTESDLVLDGGMYIDGYSGMSEMLVYLNSDAPLVIEDGGFTNPLYFTNSGTRIYTQFADDAETEPLNSALWYGKYDDDAEPSTGITENPEGSLLSFRVRVPQGTEPGQYRLWFREGSTTTEAGMKVKYFFAYNRGEDVDVTLQPFVLTVEPDFLRGDVDGNGTVDLHDAMHALWLYTQRTALFREPTDAEQEKRFDTPYIHAAQQAADVEENGGVEITDAQAILQYYTQVQEFKEPDWAEILHSDTEQNDTEQNDTEQNDTEQNDTE